LIGFELNASVDVSKRSVKIIRPTFNLFKKSDPIDENFQKK
jgi:membrane protein